jgi:hypothetical protein
MAPCRNCVNRRFGGRYRLHLQGRKQEEILELTILSRCNRLLPFFKSEAEKQKHKVLRRCFGGKIVELIIQKLNSERKEVWNTGTSNGNSSVVLLVINQLCNYDFLPLDEN